MKLDCHIDEMTFDDWPQVRTIDQEGMATGQATFQTEAPLWEVWDAGHLPYYRLVARADQAYGLGRR